MVRQSKTNREPNQMIKITPTETVGVPPAEFSYIQGRGGLGRLIMPLTRHLRAVQVERYVEPRGRLLDIGCGDGYFLKRVKCPERYGLDKLLGDEVTDRLPFAAEFFDYVTLLAVIEHIDEPAALLGEIHRVLKPGGRLIFTTPRRAADFFISLYARHIDEEHKVYHDLASVRQLAQGLFEITDYRRFLGGLNQVFCLTKIPT